MWSLAVLSLLLNTATAGVLPHTSGHYNCPVAVDTKQNLTYQGIYQSDVEAFLGIQYAQDTTGQNRFKPPQPYVYAPGSTVLAQANGPSCLQPLGPSYLPIYPTNVTNISENCLLLNVKRPNGTTSNSKLPVMVFIHGGSFVLSSKDEIVIQPSGLIIQSVLNGNPVMHVAMNYRLGVFGFAKSAALQQEGSENAGLKDQRFAIEWVKNNIAAFGGDPDNITIFGQSSGGLAVGLQIMAYGGERPIPFHQAICESQALEGGITGNFTRTAMEKLVNDVGCNTTALDSNATVECLRDLTSQQLLDGQLNTYGSLPSQNVGDIWLPAIDEDFLPDSPSNLINQGKFAAVNATIGWTEGDLDIIIPTTIRTANDSNQALRDFLPGFNESSIETLEGMYPLSEFRDNPAANLTSEFYRTSRIFRDIIMICSAIFYGKAISTKSGNTYFYHQNQTFLNPALTYYGLPDLGVVHTSEFAYVFGNLSHYDLYDWPYQPNATDYALAERQSRSWSTFAATGDPSLAGGTTLQGWDAIAETSNNVDIFVVGGAQEGLFSITGSANPALEAQKLEERCAFLNSPDIINQLGY